MGAAPAYSFYPERAPERAPRTRISVVPGRGPRTQSPALPSGLVFLAKAVAVVLVVVSLMAFARIALSSATVATSVEAQELSSRIDDARSNGAALEVSQSLLTNPTYLKQQAAGLGMAAPQAVEVIDIGADVVACDDAGNLSLSKSVALAAGAGA